MFNHRELSVLNYANGFSMWHYKAKCSYNDLVKLGHFDVAADMFNNGDMILATGETWAAQLFVRVSEGKVSVLPLSRVGEFNTP